MESRVPLNQFATKITRREDNPRQTWRNASGPTEPTWPSPTTVSSKIFSEMHKNCITNGAMLNARIFSWTRIAFLSR